MTWGKSLPPWQQSGNCWRNIAHVAAALRQSCLGFLTLLLSLQARYAQGTNNQGHLLDYRGLNYSCGYIISERIYFHKGLLLSDLSLMSLCYLFSMNHPFVEIARTKFRKVNTTVFCSQPSIMLKENT